MVLPQEAPPMNDVQRLCSDLDYLESAGLTLEQLRSLHHWSTRPEAAERVSFAIARNYFAKELPMKANNEAFAARLRLVVELHRGGFDALVKHALSKYPL